jgi:hypothetical protein
LILKFNHSFISTPVGVVVFPPVALEVIVSPPVALEVIVSPPVALEVIMVQALRA